MRSLYPLILLLIINLFSLPLMAETKFKTEVRYLHVQKGQTVHNIVKRLYPKNVKKWPEITKDIVRMNPHAFVNNNPTRMKAGVRLTLPLKVLARTKPQKQVGVVSDMSGSVIAVSQQRVSRKLANGYPVYLGDKVITGESGKVRLRMIDDAILDLRCYSIMVIEAYAISTSKGTSILNLLQGSLKKVTGKIGKLTNDIYQLKTPVAHIGVRGTEYALRVYQSKGCGGTVDADNGLYLEVIKGLVDVQNEAGEVVIAKGEMAYVPLPKSKPKKVKIKLGVLKPIVSKPVEEKPVIKPVADVEIIEPAPVEEESNSVWWWVLGIAAVVLLI